MGTESGFMMYSPTIGERQYLTEMEGLTLNGEPAIIVGWAHEFATVRQLDTGLAAEWSWEGAWRIAHGSRAFQT